MGPTTEAKVLVDEPAVNKWNVKPFTLRKVFTAGIGPIRIPYLEVPDTLEMRMTNDAYELVLLTREQRYCWPETTRGKGLVLFRLPYTFWREMQGDLYEAGKHDKVKAILAVAGLTFWADDEVSSAWHYKNGYGKFRWWDV